MFSVMQRFVVWAKAVAAVAVVVAGVNAHAQTLACATISKGGGVTSNGSIGIIGQPVAGKMSSVDFTIEVGIVPCFVARAGCGSCRLHGDVEAVIAVLRQAKTGGAQ